VSLDPRGGRDLGVCNSRGIFQRTSGFSSRALLATDPKVQVGGVAEGDGGGHKDADGQHAGVEVAAGDVGLGGRA